MIKKIITKLDFRSNYLIFIGSLVMGLFLIQFFGHGRIGDDWPNSQIASFSFWRYGESSLQTFLIEAEYFFRAWSEGQGRFLWSGQIHSLAFYWFLTSDFSRNIVSTLIVLAMNFFCTLFLYQLLSKDKRVFFYFPLAIFALTRFRWDFDPHIGFTPLLPTMLLYCGVSAFTLILSVKSNRLSRGVPLSIISAISGFIALSTYELAIFVLVSSILCGLVLIIDLNVNKKSLAQKLILFVPMATSITIYLFIVFVILRPKANPTGSYALGFSPIPFAENFFNHLFATLPLINSISYQLLERPLANFRLLTVIFSVALLLVSCLFVYRKELKTKVSFEYPHPLVRTQNLEKEASYFKVKIVASLSIMLFGPSVMIGLQPSYWGRINWGNSYLGIIVQEVALAMIVVFLLIRSQDQVTLLRRRRKGKRDKVVSKSKPTLTLPKIFTILIIIFMTSLNNQRFIESTKARDNISSSWEAITDDKWLFTEVLDRDVFFSVTHNDAYEINVGDFYTRTGIRLAHMIPPSYVWSEYGECVNLLECRPLKLELSNIQRTISNSARAPRSSFAPINQTYPRIYEDWPTQISKPGALDNSRLWFFNTYLLTPNVAISYIVPFAVDQRDNLTVDLQNLKMQQVAMKGDKDLYVGISNQCLTREGESRIVETSFGSVKVSNWTLSNPPVLLDNTLPRPKFNLDPRAIEINICPPS